MKTGHFQRNTVELREELGGLFPEDVAAGLHERQPAHHFMVAGILTLLGTGTVAVLLTVENPWVWVPAALLQGLIAFDFTVLLHEVVHRSVWRGRHDRLYALLGWLYALPSGISRSQFTRWHLDHHAELGSEADDPKRAHLSPQINARWLKLLYFTPALIPIYFRAAAREAAAYPQSLRRKIAVERGITLGVHLGAAAAVVFFFGWYAFLRVYLVPYLLVFPVAFTVNRLGQHYDIDPEVPAKWGTRMKRSLFWDAAFLWSGYHLEHHYFPGIPFYRLRRLNALLEPFFERHGIRERTYGELLFQYIARNKKPHTDWEKQELTADESR